MIATRTPTEPTQEGLAELAQLVAVRTGKPLDAWAVAAALESEGVRDVDAVERYGRRDVFDLAGAVYPLAVGASAERIPSEAPAARPPAHPSAPRACLRGAFFFVPLAIQAASLVVLGYSQWASLDFSLSQASTIAVAVGASFIATAGCAQALGYLGPVFDGSGKHGLTERVTYRMLLTGLAVALVVGLTLGLLGTLSGAYPAGLVRVGVVYYMLLSALWLVTAALYMIRAYAAMVLATLSGLAVAGALRSGAGVGIYAAQWAGLGISVLVSVGWAAARLRRRTRATTGERRLARMPPLATMRRQAAPYFVYGTLYFGFLFFDRIIGWTAGEHPLPVWFRTPYELGLDGALVSIVLGMAFLEVLVTALPALTETLQKRTRARELADHNRAHGRFHARQLVVIGALLATGIAGVYFATQGLARMAGLHEVRALLSDPVTRSVFAWGVAGYALLCLGLANAVFLFSLARPWSVVRALVPALATDAAVGLALSRTGPYWHSVFGLTAGALVFVVASGAAVRRVAREADYAYFASF